MSKIMKALYAEARGDQRQLRRYSVHKADIEGYRNYTNAAIAMKWCQVWLDGEVLLDCLMADEAIGEVECCECPFEIQNGVVRTIKKRGVVRVELINIGQR